MKEMKSAWMKAIYAVAFLVGGVTSYGLIELCPSKPIEGTIIVNPPPSVVVHDTIKTEVTKWRTLVKTVCCIDSTYNNERNENVKIRKQETGSATSSRETPPSEGTLE